MSQALPFFSIIIPTYQRLDQLRACLDALTQLDYPDTHFEVIVVDDGSSSMNAIVASFSDVLRVTFIRQKHAGPATARNTGAAIAQGHFLVFTDDDCQPMPAWLRALAAHFESFPDHLVGGRTLNALPENPYTTASQQLTAYLYTYYNADPSNGRFFASNNFAVAAEKFQQVGGFDVSFPLASSEDREFCDRWRHLGYRMSYAPEAVVYHAHALAPRTFWRLHFRYGRGAFYFRQIRTRRRQRRIQVEPLSFYLNLLRYPFRQDIRTRPWPHAALMSLSQLTNAAGFVREKFRHKKLRSQ